MDHHWPVELTAVEDTSLPPLAYCVRVSGRSATLLHGSMVATGDDFFHDGAWAGDYGAADFDAAFNCGTGGRVVGHVLRLVTPEIPVECLYVSIDDGRVLASNSMSFLMEVLDDSLDVDHMRYRDEMLAVEWGVRRSDVRLPTSSRREVRVLFGATADVDHLGGVDVRHLAPARPFDGFSDYRRTLASTIGAVLANASDGRRGSPFRPLVPMSAGYDSTAVAALGAESGVTEGITMLRHAGGEAPAGERVRVDHPGEAATSLGLDLIEVERDTWRTRTDLPESRLAASMTTTGGVSLLALDPWLPGRVVMTGLSGDIVWDVNNHRFTRDVVHPYGHLGERTFVEHRLHLGYVRLSPATICQSAHPSIHAISASTELAPWRLGGHYDRPIPRRIAEEAGVPRHSFGMKKFAASATVGNSRHHYPPGPPDQMRSQLLEAMSPASVESFMAFLDSEVDLSAAGPRLHRDRRWHRLYERSNAADHRLVGALHRLGVRFVVPRAAMQRLAARGALDADYTRWMPHWGVRETRGAYAVAARRLRDDSEGPVPEGDLR